MAAQNTGLAFFAATAGLAVVFSTPFFLQSIYNAVATDKTVCGVSVATSASAINGVSFLRMVLLQCGMLFQTLRKSNTWIKRPWLPALLWCISASLHLTQTATQSILPTSSPSSCPMPWPRIMRLGYECFWAGLGTAATYVHARGWWERHSMRRTERRLRLMVGQAQELKEMAKAIAALGEVPDVSMQTLNERRKDVQRVVQQADGQFPKLTESANQVYNELTEIMTLILMSQEGKSKTEQ
ncbi:hypothetical protein EC968_008095 [Mortierella alpina]|nr:hypothetical protein EC968_008095 [Mortierella alpina]